MNLVTVSWALGLEYHIGNLFFPFVFWIRKKVGENFLLILSISLFIVNLSILKHNSPNFLEIHFLEYKNIPMGIFRILVSYSAGVITAVVVEKYRLINKKFLFIFLEFLILIILFKFYGKVNYNRENEFVFPIIISIMIYIFSYERGILSWILKKFSILGKYSFAIYLSHPIFYEIFKYYRFKNLVLYLSVTLIFSIVFYSVVERRILELKYKK